MADWESAAKVQKNDAGEFRALIGDAWVPVARAQKDDKGAFRVMRTDMPTETAPETTPDRGVAGMAGDVLAGAVRGAGSIGATIMAPFDVLARARGSEIPFVPGRLDDRRAGMTQGLQTLGADPESTSFALGKTAAEIAGTLPIGGVLGKGVAAVTPRLAPLATSLTTGGFRTGLQPGLQNAATRAAGGAVTGGASALAVNPEDTFTGAAVGAALPTAGAAAVKLLGRGGGWLMDALTGKLGAVKAGEIARKVAGGDLAAIRAANAAAEQGLTSGQATIGIQNATWSALDALAKGQNPRSVFTRAAQAQDDAAVNELANLAGGATATEARAVQEQSKNALNAITTPMRETALAAAGTAGALQPELTAQAAGYAKGATAQVDRVRQFTAAVDRAEEWARSWLPSSMGGDVRALGMPGATRIADTYPGQLAARADQVASTAADTSLLFGEAARDAQARVARLKAAGLTPLKSEDIVSSLQSKLADPEIGTNRDAAGAVTRVAQMLQDWTNKHGVITPEALYAIRKNGVAGAIADLNPGATEDQRRQFAQSVLQHVRPLFDSAIEQAGGKGWTAYLKTFEQGMHGIEEKKLADAARQLYTSGDKQGFINLVRGNNPKLVEDIFGPGKYDFTQEMGAAAKRFDAVAAAAERDLKLKNLAPQGGEALSNIIQDTASKFNFPPSLSTKIAVARQGLREFEGKVNKATLKALAEGMQSGASANEMLATVPAKDRNTVLRIMMNSQSWNPALMAGTRQGVVNALSPDTTPSNALRP